MFIISMSNRLLLKLTAEAHNSKFIGNYIRISARLGFPDSYLGHWLLVSSISPVLIIRDIICVAEGFEGWSYEAVFSTAAHKFFTSKIFIDWGR